MSRKHPHRAGNQPVTRRYVAGVVRRARDEIISAIIHSEPEPLVSWSTGESVSKKAWHMADVARVD